MIRQTRRGPNLIDNSSLIDHPYLHLSILFRLSSIALVSRYRLDCMAQHHVA